MGTSGSIPRRARGSTAVEALLAVALGIGILVFVFTAFRFLSSRTAVGSEEMARLRDLSLFMENLRRMFRYRALRVVAVPGGFRVVHTTGRVVEGEVWELDWTEVRTEESEKGVVLILKSDGQERRYVLGDEDVLLEITGEDGGVVRVRIDGLPHEQHYQARIRPLQRAVRPLFGQAGPGYYEGAGWMGGSGDGDGDEESLEELAPEESDLSMDELMEEVRSRQRAAWITPVQILDIGPARVEASEYAAVPGSEESDPVPVGAGATDSDLDTEVDGAALEMRDEGLPFLPPGEGEGLGGAGAGGEAGGVEGSSLFGSGLGAGGTGGGEGGPQGETRAGLGGDLTDFDELQARLAGGGYGPEQAFVMAELVEKWEQGVLSGNRLAAASALNGLRQVIEAEGGGADELSDMLSSVSNVGKTLAPDGPGSLPGGEPPPPEQEAVDGPLKIPDSLGTGGVVPDDVAAMPGEWKGEGAGDPGGGGGVIDPTGSGGGGTGTGDTSFPPGCVGDCQARGFPQDHCQTFCAVTQAAGISPAMPGCGLACLNLGYSQAECNDYCGEDTTGSGGAVPEGTQCLSDCINRGGDPVSCTTQCNPGGLLGGGGFDPGLLGGLK